MQRPARVRTGRKREIPSARRKKKKKQARELRRPNPEDNFNVSSHCQHQWSTGEVYMPKTINFSSSYRMQQRIAAGLAPLHAAGPIDIRHKENTRLMAEYIATPGKRAELLLYDLSRESLCRLGTHVPQVRGPYRRQLLRKRLTHLLPQHNAPKPRDHYIRIPESLRWLKPALARFVNTTLRSVRKTRPWQARLARLHTRMAGGREEKYSDRWANERASALTYDHETV
jgi:hypothetical protein